MAAGTQRDGGNAVDKSIPSDVIEVALRGEYRLRLRFHDGVEGEIDFGPLLSFEGIFAPFRDPAYFARVRVDPEVGTICWPNGADWDALVLYSLVTRCPVGVFLTRPGTSG
jgi:hypothetical protein